MLYDREKPDAGTCAQGGVVPARVISRWRMMLGIPSESEDGYG
jgi:hypothetical protein